MATEQELRELVGGFETRYVELVEGLMAEHSQKEFSLSKCESVERDLNIIINPETEASDIKDTLLSMRGYLYETFRDTHLTENAEVGTWHDEFEQAIEQLDSSPGMSM
ncbi:MAG: hypothetical protein K0U37_04360 [Gammaproteobacteria bacterium]|nr:hypothetical protein [Gammaproteobacteria bacterium]